MPEQELKPPGVQGELFLGVKVDRKAAFQRYDGRDWGTRFMAFLRYLTEPGDKGTGEEFRIKAERLIGPPPDDHIVGSIVLRAAGDGLLKRAGYGRMRGKKAHGRETPLWERTAKS